MNQDMINKLKNKLDVHYNRLVQAELDKDTQSVENELRMIETYKSELEAARYMKPFKMGQL